MGTARVIVMAGVRLGMGQPFTEVLDETLALLDGSVRKGALASNA